MPQLEIIDNGVLSLEQARNVRTDEATGEREISVVGQTVGLLDQPKALAMFAAQELGAPEPGSYNKLLGSLRGLGPQTLAKFVSVLALSETEISFGEVVDQAEISTASVSRISGGLAHNGYARLGAIINPKTHKGAVKSLTPTLKLAQELAVNPDWQRATRFRQLSQRLELSDVETMDYLLGLGHRAIQNS